MSERKEHIKQEEISYLEHVQERANAKRQKQFSRRALLATGWAVPVVLSVGLSQAAQAKASGRGKGQGKGGQGKGGKK